MKKNLIINYLPSNYHKFLARTLRNTGARIGEVVQLKWRDFGEDQILFPATITKRKLKSRADFIDEPYGEINPPSETQITEYFDYRLDNSTMLTNNIDMSTEYNTYVTQRRKHLDHLYKAYVHDDQTQTREEGRPLLLRSKCRALST